MLRDHLAAWSVLLISTGVIGLFAAVCVGLAAPWGWSR